MIPGVSQDQEALLITLKRPVVFVQPSAFDRAVLVWLNYKNAYEYWNEQRLALNKEVQTATQQVRGYFIENRLHSADLVNLILIFRIKLLETVI